MKISEIVIDDKIINEDITNKIIEWLIYYLKS